LKLPRIGRTWAARNLAVEVDSNLADGQLGRFPVESKHKL